MEDVVPLSAKLTEMRVAVDYLKCFLDTRNSSRERLIVEKPASLPDEGSSPWREARRETGREILLRTETKNGS
jgi:hypothetical protein